MHTTSRKGIRSANLEARIISLDTSRFYYKRLAAALDKLGCPYKVVPGVVWKSLPDDDPRKSVVRFTHCPTYTYGAAGSFLAHMEAWKEAAHRPGPSMIFEDDALVDVDLLRARLTSMPDDYDVLLLSPERGPREGLFTLPVGDMRFSPTAGYITTPVGARRLLHCACRLEPDDDGWRCVDQVSWQLPIHLEVARDSGVRVLVDGTRPVSHDSKESLTRYVETS